MKRKGAIEARLFGALNRIVEPAVRGGVGSSRHAPGTLLVLETKGRRTGRAYRTPLASLRVGEHILVGTFRGRRSAWVKNLAAKPNVRFWVGGEARKAKAVVITSEGPNKATTLSPAAEKLMTFLIPYTAMGWAFAFLTPADEPRARTAAA